MTLSLDKQQVENVLAVDDQIVRTNLLTSTRLTCDSPADTEYRATVRKLFRTRRYGIVTCSLSWM